MLKILTFSTLFPNSVTPGHGIFVAKRLSEMRLSRKFHCEVIAPIPWFPFKWAGFGKYSKFARIGRKGKRDGLVVQHPRYPLIPKIGMSTAPFAMAFACLPLLKSRINNGFDFDVIDAHYYYPDGVAAALLGTLLKKPVIVTARGTDVNLFPQYFFPRILMRWAIRRVNHNITVSEALRSTLIELGASPNKVTTLRNGVDTDFFKPPENRAALREALRVESPLILSVGNLVELKGHDLTIRALAELPEFKLIIAGDGEDRGKLTTLIEDLSLQDRVTLIGAVSQERLCSLYGAADMLVLASSREGWANVLLESMACGTPVVATSVGGNPEVVSSSKAGVLVDRDVASIRSGILNIHTSSYDRGDVRLHAEQHSWEPTVTAAYTLLSNAASTSREKENESR